MSRTFICKARRKRTSKSKEGRSRTTITSAGVAAVSGVGTLSVEGGTSGMTPGGGRPSGSQRSAELKPEGIMRSCRLVMSCGS